VSIASLVLYSTLNSPLLPLFYSSFSNIYWTYLYIFLHFLSLLATNNFLLSTLLSFTFLYVLLPVHHNATRLSTLNASPFSTSTFPFFHTKFPFICHSSPLNTFTPTFFISSTTLTTSLSLLLAIFILTNISTSGPSITTFDKLYS